MASLALFLNTASAGWGIKGIYVFGDSLSDSGNAAILSAPEEAEEESIEEPPFPLELYYEGRASNGPVWIEIVAEAYGYEVKPALDGGRNFAFIGAESGTGLSDQDTPNFLEQVALFQEARDNRVIKNVHPKDLFVIWVGINDFLRLLEENGEILPEDIEAVLDNIETGLIALSEERARLFMVPTMPAVHLTPLFDGENGLGEDLLARVTDFNAGLETLLQEIESDPKITIYRLDTFSLLKAVHDSPEAYGLENTTDPLILTLLEEEPGEGTGGDEVADEDEGEEEEESTDYGYLYWDDFHPTVEGHLLIAQIAMNDIPIGSWWGRSVARGPDGTAFLGMGWVDDSHWPWVYSYSLNNGEWMWVYDEAGDPDGFFSFLSRGYKWIWLNAMSGWYFDYEAGEWKPVDEIEESNEDGEDTDDEDDDDDDDDTPSEG